MHETNLFNDIFRKMQRRVYSYEGTVRQFLVDDKGMVLIACFGIVAHENDAERATRCAMDIEHDLIKESITSSCGVTTGEVFCGLVGGETRCEYALIGDVVNMSARLMAATKDEIRVDVETYTRSCQRVVYEHLDPIKVKGKDQPIKVFKPTSGSVSAALTLRQIRLIGRKEELAMVLSRVDAFSDLSYTSAIIFEGDSGMGKTRMLQETVQALNRHKLSITPRKGSYETLSGDPYLCFIATILEEQFHLTDEMTIDARTALVKSEVQKLGSTYANKNVSLLEFVIPGLAFRRDSSTALPPGSVFTVITRMVSGIIVSAVKKEKAVFVCDNAHALDVQSWTALRIIFRGSEKNLMLVIAQRPTARNEDVTKISEWFVNASTTLCLHLAEFSKAQASALASAVFQVSRIPRELAVALFDKCRGHPRFIMELCELLLAEEKVVVEGGTCRLDEGDYSNLKLPDTMRAVM